MSGSPPGPPEVMICGGVTTEELSADPAVQQICDEMKPHAEKHAKKKFAVFVAKSYKTQVVAGTNYFIKVHLGGNLYGHLCVYKPAGVKGKLEFNGFVTPKAKDDPIEYSRFIKPL